ncbi:MAG: UDP-N-acetylmuramate--L-alanine ligase [Gemmatimonadetes bacterium]|nr:UDP-N-acetylmuramate--L-alanine ligase [Gemmatimonadota bacterium]MBT7859695.1 UDP-N-acetylmuramate--L-alanine ligase [Gemmatimonadota bacterium]
MNSSTSPLDLNLGRPRRIHMIGIAGAGMEPLACLLQQAGHDVQGSDLNDGSAIRSLGDRGIQVWTGSHDAERVSGAELVVFSAAVDGTNPELKAAHGMCVPACTRAELLGWFSRQRPMIAVAGTHGKTTTSSMIVSVARAAGEEPGVVIGGWQAGGSQAATGTDELLVAEADEFDRSFLHLHPLGAVVTNIEADHHDTYANDAAIDGAFATFLGQTQQWVVTHDNARCLRATEGISAAVDLCGLNPNATVQLEDVTIEASHCRLQVRVDGVTRPPLQLAARGRHNVDNAMTVVGVAERMGWDWDAVSHGLAQFGGVDRRLQSRGQIDGTLVIDDYAHHPTEVTAAINWARSTSRRVVAVFQPHLYSRTQHLAREFCAALSLADEVWICGIYAAREEPIPGVSSRLLTSMLQAQGLEAQDVTDPGVAIEAALQGCGEDDLLLAMGAGDISDRLGEVLASHCVAEAV